MPVHSIFAITALLFTTSAINAQNTPTKTKQPNSLKSLAWLAGSWQHNDNGKVTEENWTSPGGGMMLGTNRTIYSPEKASFEFLRIVEKDGVVTYLASPGGSKPTPFKLKSQEKTKAVFENLSNDFPQRIIYHRTGDTLIARIEGQVSGNEKSMQWTWRKVAPPTSSSQKITRDFKQLRTAVYRVDDLTAAKKWYSKTLGIEPYFDQPYYVGFKIGDQELGLDPDTDSLVRGNNQPVYWSVTNCQQCFDKLIENGATIASKPQDVGEGTVVATVNDPFGNILGIIEVPAEND